ncbi:MarR family winged helix-turn-helix transcriptional regulator [Nocardioides alcanivorans]|uniref:MarR family winged helix-turn-helix transcriptional regulator n=1 Tax=Nocardioides alcanivorans TaxID=2897352 RepID=UPI001F27D130|nr:MarR family transcriptional regulator [Nocardioides alcanivorans]
MPESELDLSSHSGLAAGLRLAVMRLRRRLVGERHPDNELSMSAMAVLGCLHVRGEQTAADLARHERVQPPTMTRMVKAMEEDGFVVRRPHETDGRQILVSITAQGRAVVLADKERRDAWLATRLERITPQERAVLEQAVPILTRLAQGD